MTLPASQWVDSQALLTQCVEACSRASAIAVDTEFMRTDTFYAILALIQICDGESIWLIDPLAIDDFSCLDDLFNNDAVLKVFHSCSEDIDVLGYQLGLHPKPLADTQVAAAFLGYGYSKGYSKLVASLLDVHLDKHETRSDWLQRPLTLAQKQYAAEDVYYLIQMHHQLQAALVEQQREHWLTEDMAELQRSIQQPEILENFYLRVKGAWKLSVAELSLLRELTVWREQQARTLNRPRNRVVSDELLLIVIKQRPTRLNDFYQFKGFYASQVRQFGEQLVDIVNNIDKVLAENKANETLPQPLPQPLARQQRLWMQTLRERINTKALALDIAPELLARKKDLEHIVRRQALPTTFMTGWRYPVCIQELLALFEDISVSDSD